MCDRDKGSTRESELVCTYRKQIKKELGEKELLREREGRREREREGGKERLRGDRNGGESK